MPDPARERGLLSTPGGLRRGVFILAPAALAAALAFWFFAIRTPPIPRRTLRIGFEQVPPVQIRTDSGFAGLAVETVNEAAKRAGISLQWVETGKSSEESLRRGLVDLWPIMIDLPGRRKRVHITRPWLYTSHTLVLRPNTKPPDRSFTGRIGLSRMPIHVRLVKEKFPEAQLVEFPEIGDIVKEVCKGTVSAGFLEDRAALAALRDKPAECAATGIRVRPLPDLTLPLGIGSTFEAAGAADRIRDEIGGLFRDGTLAATITKYSFYGLDDTWTTYGLMESAERARWFAWGIAGLGIALAVTLFQAAYLHQRKRSEAALRASEERFRAIFSQAAVGISQTGLDGAWLAVNQRFCEMLGYAEAELRGKSFLEVTHPDDLEKSRSAVRRLLAGEIPSWQAEKRYIGKGGNIVWARVSVSLVRDENNVPQYFICAVEDVTGRVRAELARRDSERRFTLAASAAHVGVWEYDLRTKAITTSGEFARLRGLAPDARLRNFEEWLGYVHPDDRERVRARALENIEKKQPWDDEFRVVWPDGSVHWLLTKGTVLLDETGQTARLAGVNLDISERKQAEAALEESEERFRNLADNAPVMMWLSGPDKLCTFFNRRWLAFAGSTMDQALGNGWIEKVHPDDRDRCYTNYSTSFDARRTFQTECRLRRADGAYRWVLATGAPRFDSNGAFAGYVGSGTDITDVKRAQEEALASQKLESLGVLAGGIAHDFNNLLGGIVAQAELASANLAEGAGPEEELMNIRAVAVRGAEIVRQLMAYAGQETDTLELVDISRLVEETIELLNLVVPKRVALRLLLGKDGPLVLANPAIMRQILINLVTNAAEAIGDRDGVIGITTTRAIVEPDSSGASGGLRAGDYLQLEVSDTGRGMTPETRARVFDPFFTTKSQGRGMGLAVVQGIVKRLGGAITVRSEPGQGSTLRILLPGAPYSPMERQDRDRDRGAARGCILVVEDEEPLRLAVSKMLRKAGFTVLEAANGSDALILLRTHTDPVTVMLLDVTLPGISSTEVLREAKRLRPDIRVILASAYGHEKVAAVFAGYGSYPFLRKPYLLADLLAAVEPEAGN
jgi:PAS domain S-box-containing protein